ncbi:putative sulfate/molybdate transporter [Variovorax sp. JS1663]|uniref:putative sulfate/molybdate transporter n=1 Tax=Variovorax sp. JS1663 TaxID=1851577 RepID=UPI001EE06CE0|nr:putative sulfate/molybdate transporter [Variovorax sp. JS1663]
MAAHVAFGARTGGATVILGLVLVVLAVFFSGSVSTIFAMFPPSVLGVILALSGAQLAMGAALPHNSRRRVGHGGDVHLERRDRVRHWPWAAPTRPSRFDADLAPRIRRFH